MGLLDDAIREHLELKRKHGADPDDVARQEQRGARPRACATSSRSPSGRRGRRRRPRAGRRSPSRTGAASPSRAAVDELPEGEPGIPEEPPAPRSAPGYDEDPWLDEEPRRGPRRRGAAAAPAAPRRRRRGGRAGGDAGVPPGDAGARPPVVRAEAAARLRLGQVDRRSQFRRAPADHRGVPRPPREAPDAIIRRSAGPNAPDPRFAASTPR